MHEFNCLAKCNGASSTLKFAEKTSIDEFRKDLALLNTQKNYFIAADFYRADLGQSGSGHFSPIGGYNPKKDLVLILDVARYKYAPYWVSVELFYKSMCKVDSEAGHSRGWCILTKLKNQSISLFFQQIQHDINTDTFISSILSFNDKIQDAIKNKEFEHLLKDLDSFNIETYDEKTMDENHKKFIDSLYKEAKKTSVSSVLFKDEHNIPKEKVILLVVLCLLSPHKELNSQDYDIGNILKEEILFFQQMIQSIHSYQCDIKK